MNSSDQTSRIARWGWLLFLTCDRCSFRHLRGIVLFHAVAVSLLLPRVSLAVELQSDTGLATAGYYQLTWDAADSGNGEFQLQEANRPDFSDASLLYQGPDKATVVTGRPDDTYYYRVRLLDAQSMPGAWSDAVKVEVEHHPLSRALTFFIVGAVVFIAILVVIVVGNKQHRNKE